MLELLTHPGLDSYAQDLHPGDSLFLEGDLSKDLFILASGRLDILKNGKKIHEVTAPGEMVGEMSFLLDSPRTATVVCGTPARVIRIPADRIDRFFCEFGSLLPQIIRTLAQRLRETTQVAHGFAEFCDQLPDAVIMTDANHLIVAWNKAAERLHGRSWQEMKGQKLSDVFRNPEQYGQFIDDLLAGRGMEARVLTVLHPDGDVRHVSTSTTVLYDGHYNVAGYVFLSRNVTELLNLEKKYRRIRGWFIPAVASLALFLVGLSLVLPSMTRGIRILDQRKKTFGDRITAVAQTLGAELGQAPRDPETIRKVLDGFLASGSRPEQACIAGFLLLNADKRVEASASPAPESFPPTPEGTNYSGIPFAGASASPFKVLSLYRTTRDNPMGVKHSEIAYELGGSDWLVIQLDSSCLTGEFGIDPDEVPDLRFGGAGGLRK